MTATQTRTRGYVNVPPYETLPTVQVRPTTRYGFATRPAPGVLGVAHVYATIHEARRHRENARRRNEWVSHLLVRVGPRDWVPANPRLRAMYATPAQATA